MVKAITRIFRKLDAFGYPVNLYYHPNDNKMRSTFGAMGSIFTFSILLYYFVILILQVRDPEKQKISYKTYQVDLTEEPEFNLQNQSVRFFFVLRKPDGIDK